MKTEKNKAIEWDWGKESDKYDTEVEIFWRQMDHIDDNTNWEQKQIDNKKKFAEMLRTSIGKDMNDVMNGKTVVKLPFKMKLRHWFKRLIEIFS